MYEHWAISRFLYSLEEIEVLHKLKMNKKKRNETVHRTNYARSVLDHTVVDGAFFIVSFQKLKKNQLKRSKWQEARQEKL